MIRSLILSATAAAAAILPSASGVATADPTTGGPCSYTLTPPHVVSVSGTDMVTATLTPAACDRANVYLTVACIQIEGGDGPGQCAQNNGPLVAQVFFAPRKPGATYIATGRGCANTDNPPQPQCQPVGPFTAQL